MNGLPFWRSCFWYFLSEWHEVVDINWSGSQLTSLPYHKCPISHPFPSFPVQAPCLLLLPPPVWNDAVWPDPRAAGRPQALLPAHRLRLPHRSSRGGACPDSGVLEKKWLQGRAAWWDGEIRWDCKWTRRRLPLFLGWNRLQEGLRSWNEGDKDCSLSLSQFKTPHQVFSLFYWTQACRKVSTLSFLPSSSRGWTALWQHSLLTVVIHRPPNTTTTTTIPPPPWFSSQTAMTRKRTVNIIYWYRCKPCSRFQCLFFSCLFCYNNTSKYIHMLKANERRPLNLLNSVFALLRNCLLATCAC